MERCRGVRVVAVQQESLSLQWLGELSSLGDTPQSFYPLPVQIGLVGAAFIESHKCLARS